jgi:hypothetical protein
LARHYTVANARFLGLVVGDVLGRRCRGADSSPETTDLGVGKDAPESSLSAEILRMTAYDPQTADATIARIAPGVDPWIAYRDFLEDWTYLPAVARGDDDL